jgi:hypothetical protein
MAPIAKNDIYEISLDASKNGIYLKISGYWKSKSDAFDYVKDIGSAAKAVKNGFSIVSDLREMKTPSPEAGALHEEAQSVIVKAGLDKTAEVIASAVTKLSTKKYSDASGMKKQVFATVEDAEKWLDS